jgi:hypothetical protein
MASQGPVCLLAVIEHRRTFVLGENQTFRPSIDRAYYLIGAKKGRYPVTMGDNPVISRQYAKVKEGTPNG